MVADSLAWINRSNGAMLKRRPSKRFVLAETGEEPSWDITTDNDGGGKVTSPVPPPVINLETAVPSGSTSASSSICEDGPPQVGDGDGSEAGGVGGASGNSGSGGGSGAVGASGAGELKVPALHNLKLTESGRLK